jgi:hypothetical protein
VDPTQKRRLENTLMMLGLSRLNDRNLVPQMAAIINEHRGYKDGHEFFVGLLNSCDISKRTEMYEALRPHLSFEPYPLAKYMTMLEEHAANVESRSAPLVVGEKKYQRVSARQATACVITMKCHVCSFTAQFTDKTVVSTVIQARQRGWVRDLILNKEVCPKCPAERAQRRKCPTCSRRHYPPACNVISIAEDQVEAGNLVTLQ